MRNDLPVAFVDNIKMLLSHEAEMFIASLSEHAPVSVRLNPFKPCGVFEQTESVRWCATGRYLPARPQFTLDPLFHAGAYYVQEASSMFLEQALTHTVDVSKPLKVLDLCAAPGGKSTLLLSLLHENSLLVANELIARRNNILCENITKWGNCNVVVTQNEAADFSALPEFFDVILVDAPCSGEGLFRKDADAIAHWSMENVEACAERQSVILNHVLPALKIGGILIYSTCTYEETENENVIRALVESGNFESMNPQIASPDEVVKTEWGFRFYTHRVRGEGFFISCLKKTREAEANISDTNSLKKQIGFLDEAKVPFQVRETLSEKFNPAWFLFRNEIAFVPVEIIKDVERVARVLQVRQAGASVGFQGKYEFEFSHSLAMSNKLKKGLQSVGLSRDEALKFLKGEALQRNEAKGWQLVRFEGLPLGWAKAITGRLNNHYPKNWRIKMHLS